MGWREKPLGTGEAVVIIIPIFDNTEEVEKQLNKLGKVLKVSTFSEETIQFFIEELDREEEKNLPFFGGEDV
jgi:hypothetical protein